MENFSTVFPECGMSNSAIELSIGEFAECSGLAAIVDVGKNRRGEDAE